jgi:hydroxypyruvate isomerase
VPRPNLQTERTLVMIDPHSTKRIGAAAAEQPPRYAANCSILLTELPMLQRPAAARAAGFDAVEYWWPFDRPAPREKDIQAFVTSVSDAGVQLVSIAFDPGDIVAGDRGLISSVGRAAQVRDNMAATADVAHRLGCSTFVALYGTREDSVKPAEQDETAVQQLGYAASLVADLGGQVVLEPLSGTPAYPIKTVSDAVTVLSRVTAATGQTNIGVLADLYHLAANGTDVDVDLARFASWVGHVQVADAPGRTAPGRGTLPLNRWVTALYGRGYTGWVGLEFLPDPEFTLKTLPSRGPLPNSAPRMTAATGGPA